MKRIYLFVAILLLFLLTLVSCGGAIRSGANPSPGVDVDRGSTFSWAQQEDRVVGDPRLEHNRFFEDRLHEAIEWEMSLRGIRLESSSPDFSVHHHLSLADHEMLVEVIDESGYPGTTSYTYEEGSVVVHIEDAKTGESLWIGWAQANVETALHSPDNMRSWVYDLVGSMFKSWPVPARDR